MLTGQGIRGFPLWISVEGILFDEIGQEVLVTVRIDVDRFIGQIEFRPFRETGDLYSDGVLAVSPASSLRRPCLKVLQFIRN